MDKKKQDKVDELYLRMAFTWSENSYAVRRKVGCLIVKNNSIISDGYNGTPSGFRNICEYEPDASIEFNENCTYSALKNDYDAGLKLVTYPYVLHAESNAIAKLAKSNNSSEGATIYVTDEPCLECAKMIIQSGIKRVVYSRSYRIHEGIELLEKANIQVKQIVNFSEND